MDAGGAYTGYTSPPGGIDYPKDVEDILQVQPFASLRSLSLRERGPSEILNTSRRLQAENLLPGLLPSYNRLGPG